jgi:hypothetical protein
VYAVVPQGRRDREAGRPGADDDHLGGCRRWSVDELGAPRP